MQVLDACEALNAKLCVELTYSGRERVIEVHAVGYTRENKLILRAYQVRGGSSGGDAAGWKLFRLDEVSSAKITEEASEAPRDGYRRNDPAMIRIVCQV
jgi:hypothetical protein